MGRSAFLHSTPRNFNFGNSKSIQTGYGNINKLQITYPFPHIQNSGGVSTKTNSSVLMNNAFIYLINPKNPIYLNNGVALALNVYKNTSI